MIKRIIARLDIKNNFLVKGMHLEGLRILGYPEFFAEKYFEENIDEIIFQDIVASLYKRNQLSSLTNKISKNIFVPITVGGGIRNINDIKEALVNGADRVSINTAAVNDKKFIKESVKLFGSSTITIMIETLKVGEKYKVYTDSGRTETNLDTFDWIKEVQDLVIGTKSLSLRNWKKTRYYANVVEFYYFNRLLQIPILLISRYCGASFTRLFSKLAQINDINIYSYVDDRPSTKRGTIYITILVYLVICLNLMCILKNFHFIFKNFFDHTFFWFSSAIYQSFW